MPNNQSDDDGYMDRVTRPGNMLEPGMQVGPFRLDKRLGKGGMGEVWRAEDPSRGDSTRRGYVALKFLPQEIRESPRELRRALDTFRAVHALQHANICPVYSLQEHHGFGHVLAMKYIHGMNLLDYRERYVQREGSFPVSEVIRVLRPIAQALDYAHRPEVIHRGVARVIHRDIKPENILISEDGREIQLVDFGLAFQIRSSMIRVSQVEVDSAGTRPYMAPEQWQGQEQDAQTDQYGLAVVAYELLADRLPFDVGDSFLLRQCVLTQPVPPLSDQTAAINRALSQALSKSRGERFADCLSFINALATTETPSPAQPLPVEHVKSDVKPSEIPSSSESDDDWDGMDSDVSDGDSEKDGGIADADHNDDLMLDDSPPTDDAKSQASPLAEGVQEPTKRAGWFASLFGAASAAAAPARTSRPGKAPALLQAPFDARAAAAGQQAWAKYLGQPVEWTNSIGMKFRLIPPGEFLMGSSEDEEGARSDERPQHRVQLTQPFYLGMYPVTQAEYQQVMGQNPSHCGGAGHLPVDSVSWEDAQAFLQAMIGREKGRLYRLPSEAQWEYACRAGTLTPCWFGSQLNGQQANCNGNHPYGTNNKGPYLGETVPVGQYAANPFGLFDQHGQVWEWCQDWYGKQYYQQFKDQVAVDPIGPASGSSRCLRGGSWYSNAVNCRSGYRLSSDHSTRVSNIGFRVLLVLS